MTTTQYKHFGLDRTIRNFCLSKVDKFQSKASLDIHMTTHRFETSAKPALKHWPAVILLIYCRCGVKHYPINQSINTGFSRETLIDLKIKIDYIFSRCPNCASLSTNK